jgi:hypothetical protein
MARNLSIDRIDSSLREVWVSCTMLARSMAYSSYFCSGGWLRASADNLSRRDELLVLAVRCDDSIKAVLPLVIKPNVLGGRDIHFLGSDYRPDPVGLICSIADRAVYAEALKHYLLEVPGWDRLILDWVLEDEIRDWQIAGSPISPEPFLVLPSDINDLLRLFKQKKRYNMKSIVKKVHDAGGLLRTSLNSESNELILEDLFRLHSLRASERSIASSFVSPTAMALHRRLVVEDDAVRLYSLELNGKVLAVIYGFEFCSRFFYYQIGHDPAYGNMSPGSVLLYLVIEECCRRGLREFNFLQGDESYKQVWTNERRVLYRGIIEQDTLRSSIFRSIHKSRQHLRRIRGSLIHGA